MCDCVLMEMGIVISVANKTHYAIVCIAKAKPPKLQYFPFVNACELIWEFFCSIFETHCWRCNELGGFKFRAACFDDMCENVSNS